MKKSIHYLPLLSFMLFVLIACSNNSDNNSSENSLGEVSPQVTSDNCFEKFHGKPEELLTKDLVGEFIDFNGAEVEVEKLSDQVIRDIDFAQVNCKWRIDRQRQIVRLSKIFKVKLYKSPTSLDRFYSKYHNRTPEEQEKLKNQYDSLVLNSETVKQKTNQSTAKLLSETIGFNFSYINIENVGDAAVWEYKVNNLIVLVGDYQFTVNVDLNQGNDYDLEKAKLIANAIIKKACS